MQTTSPQSPQQAAPEKKKSNACIWIIIVIVIVLVVLGIGGSIISGFFAKKIAEKGVESVISSVTNGAVDVNTKDNTVTIKGDNGATTTVGSQKLPSNFPSDIPVYTGATVLGTTSGLEGSNTNVFVSLNSTDSMDKVKAFYDTKLPENGWVKGDSIPLGTIVTYIETKGDRQLSVTLTPYADSQVHITLAESKK